MTAAEVIADIRKWKTALKWEERIQELGFACIGDVYDIDPDECEVVAKAIPAMAEAEAEEV